MNTANLQMEGLLLALGSLMRALEKKGLLSQDEIAEMLREAEARATRDDAHSGGLSAANLNAVMFPIRFLGRDLSGDKAESYADIATAVARGKHD
ncbi:hypothetical protein GRZ55_12235 [Chelativorans sp. ZYF759]|uniref:hypothetical protein n=1 Tax=Chelativorans sp. ZYF759 TaxID=2692213 RepID=UPI00145F3964|nr:hypothetical protein [Chelativorans sp. ZYF759]NMG40010.1 hypothetical protein [Chelativorans sp. ZYF759]